MFCDSLDCPNYTYSDILRLHAYYISKKEIKLKEFQKSTVNKESLNTNDHDDNSISSFDFNISDSESNSDNNQEDFESQKLKKNQKKWSDHEIKCLITGFNKFGNQWQKIIKNNPDTFVNKNSANLKSKINQLKKDPKYSYLFD